MGTVSSTFQKRPAYKYIRESDKLPTYSELNEDDGHFFSNIACPVKLFNPTGVGTWWIAAYDPDSGIAWGVAELGYEREVGSISMDELVTFRGKFNLPVERDLHYSPQTIETLLAGGRRNG